MRSFTELTGDRQVMCTTGKPKLVYKKNCGCRAYGRLSEALLNPIKVALKCIYG